MKIGNIALRSLDQEGRYRQNGQRYKTLGMTTSVPVDMFGKPTGPAFSHEPMDDVEPLDALAPVVHDLKTLHPFFQAIWEGKKTFEIRKDDRGFEVGDVVRLRETTTTEDNPGYTGRTIFAVVSYLTTYEQQPGYVVFSLSQMTFHGGL